MLTHPNVERITRPVFALVRHVVSVLRREGRALLVADAIYNVVAAVLLFPLVGLLINQLVALSGEPALAGEDLLASLWTLRGGPVLLLVVVISITIRTLDCATLMCIVLGADQGFRVAPVAAIVFTLRRSWRIVYVTAKHLAAAVPVVIPLVGIAYLIYRMLLGRHDINFYLSERPGAFWLALMLGGVLLGIGLILLLPLFRSWIDMLPRTLFTGRFGPRDGAAPPTRRGALSLMICLAVWALSNFLLATFFTGLITWGGRELVRAAAAQPMLIVPAAAFTWLVLTVVNYLGSFLATASLATILAERFVRTQTTDQCLKHLGQLRPPRGLPLVQTWLWRRRIVLAGCGLLVGVAVISHQLTATQSDHFPQVIAHRGASLAFPENTLAAIQGAIDVGADWVEIDVQEAADGVVVVIHDSDLKKIAGRAIKVWEATAEELRALDIGSWFGESFADQRVPTLEQVLAVCKGEIRVMIELKSYGRDQQLEQRVIELVEAAGMERDVAIISLRLAAVRKVRRLRPDWPVGLLVPVAVGNPARIDADFLAVSSAHTTGSLIRAAHARGKSIHVWTVNDSLHMSRLIDAGVDGIITDDPGLMRELIRQRSGMHPLQKMLLRTATLLGIDPLTPPADAEG